MRICDVSSDVCSSDLGADRVCALTVVGTWLDRGAEQAGRRRARRCTADRAAEIRDCRDHAASKQRDDLRAMVGGTRRRTAWRRAHDLCRLHRSEEHTSELQSLMRISYAVFCLKKKTY